MNSIGENDYVVSVNITCDAAGNSTDYTDLVQGKIINAIRFVDTDMDAGVDFTITNETTGETILTLANQAASATFYPATLLDDLAGGAPLLAVYARPSVGHSRIKIVTAQGGVSKSCAFHFELLNA